MTTEKVMQHNNTIIQTALQQKVIVALFCFAQMFLHE